MRWRLLRLIAQRGSRTCPATRNLWSSSGRLFAPFLPRSLFYRASLKSVRRRFSSADDSVVAGARSDISSLLLDTLRSCPGCGAYTQVVDKAEPGFYSPWRKAVRDYVNIDTIDKDVDPKGEQIIVAKTLENVGPQVRESLGFDQFTDAEAKPDAAVQPPFCDRCHDLVHHSKGASIVHPTIESIQETLAESPHKYNHIYHVLDAADFPLSLVPNIHWAIGATSQRSKNRRSKQIEYRHSKRTEISFVITRSDLLAPKKEQVDRLMPHLVSVLRDALGSHAENARLGNVHCVSAKRGWWTRDLKADIWRRGAGGWMFGKVNVGKSNLFEAVFPKGNADEINFDKLRREAILPADASNETENPVIHSTDPWDRGAPDLQDNDESLLLPPLRSETPYPTMPTISSLPGTTASPIRIPFGNGRGELIDLPGLSRSQLDTFVLQDHRDDLVMKSRISPEQYVLKNGKSLLLGGLIRITPVDSNSVILAYPFVPIKPHMTSTDKAIQLEKEGKSELSGVPLIVEERARDEMAHAGRFQLKWEVTKQRAGPLTTRSGVGLKPSQLPFKVLSADILIEGIGWVELVAQVRKKPGVDEPNEIPEVDVFSPQGKSVGVRRSLGAWLLGNHSTKPGVKRHKMRPRKAMANAREKRKGVKSG